jgi:hypothetical protein
VLLREGEKDRMVELALQERAVCFDDDVVLMAVVDNGSLLAKGVDLSRRDQDSRIDRRFDPNLNLIDRWGLEACFLYFLNVTNTTKRYHVKR